MSGITFKPLFEQAQTLTLFMLLLAIFLFCVWSAKKRIDFSLRLILVCLANGLAMVSIIAFILQPHIKTTVTTNIVLLTNGSEKQVMLDQHLGLQAVSLSQAHANQMSQQLQQPVSFIPSINALFVTYPNLKQVQLYGHGLMPSHLDSISDLKLSFTPAPIDTGFNQLRWTKHINIGEPLQINGQFHYSQSSDNQSSDIHEIQLINPAGKMQAKTRVSHKDNFELSTIPKTQGIYDYQLHLLNRQQQVIKKHTLAIQVHTPNSPNIGFMLAAPSFESRYLSNWLTQQGVTVSSLNAISKKRFHRIKVNDANKKPTVDTPFISEKQLRTLDLLVLDGRSILALPPEQSDIIEQAVQQGLGLLIWADSELVEKQQLPANEPSAVTRMLKGFSLEKQASTINDVYPLWSQNTLAKNNKTALSAIARIKATLKQDLLTDAIISSNIGSVVMRKPMGLGFVGISTLQNQYRWLNHGQQALYSQFWQQVLSNISRREVHNRFINTWQQEPNFVGEAQTSCLTAPKEHATLALVNVATNNIQQLKWQQNLGLDTNRCATFWPQMSGWHKIAYQQPSEHSDNNALEQFQYYEDDNAWVTLRQQQKVAATLRTAIKSRSLEPKETHSWQALNKGIFWVLFILSASFIWWEQKSFKQK